ncbi:ABC-2 type transport system permease protein [Desulfatibacillum alkenivorans DSM 16219]|uniref:ABC-2 type transport system permease protein n=1 Tax=Desulfatibacillum alkenivorans DSM 16219 TaxID=1121393 RepID=A0A1M7A0M7_9BACT|nr:ABC transporter permease [Desulfatibacillum alkenivorans]SHL36264.1 ABC-2 type transport system permease protein [Desulfatibacillum alkenivorans DSM 16219]
MKPMRIFAVARKEFLHIFRDPRSLAMAIAIPMLLLVLFGYALTLDVDDVPIAVWDRDATPASRDFISRFSASPYFTIVRHVDGYEKARHCIDSGEALAFLVIPEDFSETASTGQEIPVQFIVDGSDSNTATIAMGYADTVAATWSRRVMMELEQRLAGKSSSLPVDMRPRVWFNPDMESKNYIIPGLIAVIMMVIAALLTSLTVAREWERGTMEQLISTPVKGPELILGKFLPYFVIGMFDVFLAVLMGEYMFHVPLRGSAALLFFMAAIFLAGALSVGMLISIVTKSQLLASQLAMVVTFLPSFLLSGFMYAIANMPRPIQVMTHLVPARYFVALLKGIYLKGIGLEILFVEAGLLAVFGIVVVLLANVKFKKKLV